MIVLFLVLHVWSVAGIAGLADIDWDVVLAVAMGIGAAAVAWIEHRRTSKLDTVADDLRERLAALETEMEHTAMRADVLLLDARLDSVASPPDLTLLAERVAAIADRQVAHAERLSVLEARADHQPWRHTRRKDGKFASPSEPEPTP